MKSCLFSELSKINISDVFLDEIEIIEGNPFYRCVEESKIATWLMNNESMVKHSIQKVFNRMNFYNTRDREYFNQKVDECFDYVIFYVLDRDKEFDKDYFMGFDLVQNYESSDELEDLEKMLKDLEELDEEEQLSLSVLSEELDYGIKHYALSMTKKISFGFYRDVSKERNMKRIADEKVGDKYNSSSNDQFEDSNTMDSSRSLGMSELNLPVDRYVEFTEYDDMFNLDLHIYDDDFQNKGLVDFKTRDFIYAVFLGGFDSDAERCAFLKIDKQLYDSKLQKFKAIVKNKTHASKPKIEEILIQNKYLKEEILSEALVDYPQWKLLKEKENADIELHFKSKLYTDIFNNIKRSEYQRLKKLFSKKHSGNVLEFKINERLKYLVEEDLRKRKTHISILTYLVEKGYLSEKKMLNATVDHDLSTEYSDLVLTIKTLSQACKQGWEPKL